MGRGVVDRACEGKSEVWTESRCRGLKVHGSRGNSNKQTYGRGRHDDCGCSGQRISDRNSTRKSQSKAVSPADQTDWKVLQLIGQSGSRMRLKSSTGLECEVEE